VHCEARRALDAELRGATSPSEGAALLVDVDQSDSVASGMKCRDEVSGKERLRPMDAKPATRVQPPWNPPHPNHPRWPALPALRAIAR